MEILNSFITMINDFLWSSVIIILLVGAGFYFTFKTKAVQLRHFKRMFNLIIDSAGNKTSGKKVSSFQAFCI
ncbi:MAG: sodium:alanine symporter family protein, partial [Dialister micraerophilus]|nr:sodium:alanine symporter family protein [Dialister micraerophilus]